MKPDEPGAWPFEPQVDAQAFAALGFAASSAGIARRQRDCREGWWAHAERSKAFIMNAAMRARKHGLAVVLGAGKAYDLPLAELAGGFKQVMLIDIDAAALADASAAAVRDSALRRRLELRALDLTGVTGRLVRGIQDAIAGAADAAAAEATFEELCGSYRLAEPPRLVPGVERADLLVSALMLTQLALPAKLLARQLFEQRFGPVQPGADPRWVKAWNELDLRMQQDHIDALTAQADLAVLTSEVTHHVMARVPGGSDRPTGESWSLIGARTLDERVPGYMEIVASSTWAWPRIRASGRSPGARMDVGAVALRRRGDS